MTKQTDGHAPSLSQPNRFDVLNPAARDQAIAVCLMVVLFAVYLFTYRGGFHSIDEVSMFSVTESIAKRGELDTNQIAWSQWTTSQREAQGFFGRDGNVYSKKGLAMSLFAAPLYWLALKFPGLGMLQVTSLLNALVTAATGGMLYLYARRLRYSVTAGALLGLTFGLATSSWVYARYLFSEPVAGWLLVMTGLFLLEFKQSMQSVLLVGAGLAVGLAVVARANNVLCVPLFGLYLLATLIRRDEKGCWRPARRWLLHLLIFGASLAVAGSVLALYNWVRSGNAFQTGYDLTIFSPVLWMGLYKLLFSPLRGLLVFSPILLLTPFALVGFQRRYRAEAVLTTAILLVNILLFSAWTSGEGLSWGSRFLVPVLAFAVLPLVDPLQRLTENRWSLWLPAFIVFGCLSIGIQILGVLVNPWLHFARLHEFFGAEFLEETPALYASQFSPIWGQIQQLIAWTPAKSDIAWLQPWGIETGIALVLFLLVIASVAALVRLASVRRFGAMRLALVSLLLVVLAGGISVYALERYFAQDRQFGTPDDALHHIMADLTQKGRAGDGVVTLLPYHYHVPMNIYKPGLPIYGFSQMSPPLPPAGERLLQNVVQEHDRIWLVTHGVRPGEAPNEVERWLAGHAFKATDDWYDDFRLCLYASPPGAGFAETSEQSAAIWRDRIRLRDYAVNSAAYKPGELVSLSFDWEALQGDLPEYKVFTHLIAPDGTLVAQRDTSPVDEYRPTSAWDVGEVIRDRHALLLSSELQPGRYVLWVGWYDPVTGERLPVRLPDGSEEDHLVLGGIEVE